MASGDQPNTSEVSDASVNDPSQLADGDDLTVFEGETLSVIPAQPWDDSKKARMWRKFKELRDGSQGEKAS